MESGSIADTQISGSSEWDAHHAASLGRLHSKTLQSNAGSWWARTNDENQWLQIDLGDQATKVTGVATQGGGNPTNHWVRKYKLQYSEDGETFHDYREQQHDTAKVGKPLQIVRSQFSVVLQFIVLCTCCYQ